MKILVKLVFFICLSALYSCSSERAVDSSYFKTFEHIMTNQYIERHGQGGIYWVSNQHVVLEAYIENKEGVLDRGLYQVDVNDGEYIKVVDIPDEAPTTYKFCFDGNVLHVMRKRGEFSETVRPVGYRVDIRKIGEMTRPSSYSALRCNFIEKPTENSGYKALRHGDGFLKYQRDQIGERHVFIADDSGKNLKKLIQQKIVRKGSPVGMFTVKYFIENKDAYFGYSPWSRENCTELWWLYRDGWRYENEQLCLTQWASGSKVVHDLNDALYIEHHSSKKDEPKLYVIYKGNELPIEMDKVRGSSVSPNGCLVAYGADKEDRPVRQKLKLFNYCAFQQKEL
jgi:hypothetical protein